MNNEENFNNTQKEKGDDNEKLLIINFIWKGLLFMHSLITSF